MRGDERFGHEGEHRPTGDRGLRPLHLLADARQGDVTPPEEAIEHLARRGGVAAPQQLNGAVDLRAGFGVSGSGGVRRTSSSVHGAVALRRAHEALNEREPRDEVGGRDDEDVAQAIAIARARGGIGRGGVEEREGEEDVRVAGRLAAESPSSARTRWPGWSERRRASASPMSALDGIGACGRGRAASRRRRSAPPGDR